MVSDGNAVSAGRHGEGPLKRMSVAMADLCRRKPHQSSGASQVAAEHATTTASCQQGFPADALHRCILTGNGSFSSHRAMHSTIYRCFPFHVGASCCSASRFAFEVTQLCAKQLCEPVLCCESEVVALALPARLPVEFCRSPLHRMGQPEESKAQYVHVADPVPCASCCNHGVGFANA